jgi:hypothetical protein
MKSFLTYLKEEKDALGHGSDSSGDKLKHIHHAEDRPLLHGPKGFEHAHGSLLRAHTHMSSGAKNSNLSMKYDGSPAVVYGHHPKSGKFFVASKSAFNKTPKINYSHSDIDKHHGHAPGLADKLKAALDHLPKVAPKSGVYQGDLMHSKTDVTHHENGSASFTPNTITYTAHGKEADEVKKSKVGIVTHTQYHGKDLESMSAKPLHSSEGFGTHKDVYQKSPEHDTSKVSYPKDAQDKFHAHMNAAKDIHNTHSGSMYKATERHQGEGGHMATYINSTVKNDQIPTASGFKSHVAGHYEKAVGKLKSEAGQAKKTAEGAEHQSHIEANKSHYDNMFAMHHHLHQAKNTLVKHLESHEGGLEHHIAGQKSKPEGFVVHHDNEPTKLVNRAEFAKANLLKVRK